MNNSTKKPECWSKFFRRIKVGNTGNNGNEEEKDQNVIVIGYQIELNGNTC